MSIYGAAIDYLDRAIRLAKSQDAEALRYAALDLRYAIELLVYKFLPLYRDEVTDEVLKEWRPQVILDALVEANPDFVHGYSLRMSTEHAPGVPSGRWLPIGTQTGLSPRGLRAAYHRLGNFLHARLDGEHHNTQKLRRSVEQVIQLIEPYRKDTVISNLAERYSLVCGCGRTVKRRTSALRKSPFVRCPDSRCKIMYEIDLAAGRWKPVTSEFKCPGCDQVTNYSPTQLEEGATVTCDHCSKKWLLKPYLFPVAR